LKFRELHSLKPIGREPKGHFIFQLAIFRCYVGCSYNWIRDLGTPLKRTNISLRMENPTQDGIVANEDLFRDLFAKM